MHGTKEERARFAAAIQKVALVTPKKEKPDGPTLRLYFEALNDFNLETIEEVANELIRTEQQMYAVPPPGRWRQVANTLFELKPLRATYVAPTGLVSCDYCQDTGWRLVRRGHERFVTGCECRTGGVPIDESEGGYHLDRPLIDLEGEIGPPAGKESELAQRRREHGNLIVTCACCGASYRIRQGWKCCSPPVGVPSHVWFERWHLNCPHPAPFAVGAGKRRCPEHCLCSDRRPKSNLFPLPAPGEHLHEWAVRTGLRDANAPGPQEETHEPKADSD